MRVKSLYSPVNIISVVYIDILAYVNYSVKCKLS